MADANLTAFPLASFPQIIHPMTVLEGNQAYRAAMAILWQARLAVHSEHDEIAHALICHAQTKLTQQETRDMEASFAALHTEADRD